MQTTLLGIAIAVILALLAALVGPLFVDWNRYRAQFETEASRLVGLPVRVKGEIDARLLPSPTLILSGIEIDIGGEEQTLRARALGLEFALGPLVRGEFRAAQVRVVGPDITLALDQDGRVALPKAAIGFNIDALAIDRLTVEDARLVLADAASSARAVLEKLWFNGELRSLAGPIRGEGAFVLGGGLYGYRLATARPENGGVRIKFSLDPSDRPLGAEGEGMLTFERELPRFEGALTLTRAVGTVLAGGKTVLGEPWRIASRVKASPASALLEQLEFQYGPDQRAIKLTGTAEVKFGARARLDGVLSARQLDLDRLIATPEAPSRLPAAALAALAERFVVAWRPPFPVQIGIGVDNVTLGGGGIQSLRGDLKSDREAWTIEDLEFRAPGFTQVQMSGRLALAPAGIAFQGPADVTAADPRALIGWLEGRSDIPAGAGKPLRARGEVTIGRETFGVERLQAEFDRKSFDGRLAYSFGNEQRKARLEAELRAPELDIDGLIDFGNAALAGTTIERPGEVALAFDIGRARIANIEAREAKAKLKVDAEGLQIERLSFADFGGVKLDASGRIDTMATSPRGNIALDLDARDLTGVTALVAKFAPDSAEPMRALAERLGPARLHATLSMDAAPAPRAGTSAKLDIQGNAGGLRLALNTEAVGNSADIASSDIRVQGTLAAEDTSVLFQLLGLQPLLAPDRLIGALHFVVQGPLNGDLRVETRLATATLQSQAAGVMRVSIQRGVEGTLDLAVSKADLRGLRALAGRNAEALPATLHSRLGISGKTLKFENLSAIVAGTPLSGQLSVTLEQTPRIEGVIEADILDAGALLAAAIGAPFRQAESRLWPADPFAPGFLRDAAGRIELRTKRAMLTSALAVNHLRASLRLSPSQIALEDIDGELAGGRLSGALSFRKAAGELAAQARIALEGADAAIVIAGEAGAPVAGRLMLRVDVEGTGRSPKALVGALAGSGAVSLDNAEIAGLDSGVFAAVMRAADQGMTFDAAATRNAVAAALDAGRLKLAHAEGAISVGGGQARLGTLMARAQGADLAMFGNLDLNDDSIDLRMTLAGQGTVTSAGRPEIAIALKGPRAAPQRVLDVSALTGWLALRSVEQQSKQLEAIEGGQRAPGGTSPAPAAKKPTPGAAIPPRSAPPPGSETKGVERAPQLPAPVEIKPASPAQPRAPAVPAAADGRNSDLSVGAQP